MSRLFSLFLDRLAQRFAVLLAGSLSSRVEGLHAAVQADQQSQLEDLARKYEADGKTDIAAALRQRASHLTSADLAAEAVEVVDRLTTDSPRLVNPGQNNPPCNLQGLPDFSKTPLASSKKRRRTTDDTNTANAAGVDL